MRESFRAYDVKGNSLIIYKDSICMIKRGSESNCCIVVLSGGYEVTLDKPYRELLNDLKLE